MSEGVPRVDPAGDAALLVTLGNEISLEVNSRVRALARAVEAEGVPGVQEMVIGYATLLLFYDPLRTTFEETRDRVLRLADRASASGEQEGRLREIPTVFGGAYGRDLPSVALLLGMSEEEVLRIFTGATFTVFMLGFAPGNPYLGGLPPKLALPRLESPRERVPAGTVAIANQATIYALTSPGGWRWLGRTPIKLFDPAADPPVYLQDGDRVRFVPISEEEYLRMGGERAE
ncbi:MAG: 5-oxoprolinase subunit PxpB [Sphingomonadaceae bacterium]